MSGRLRLYILVAAMISFWGVSFVFTKMALSWMGPMGIAFIRWLISAVAMGGWLASTGKLKVAVDLLRREPWALVLLALTGITLFYALENVALRFTSAVNAGILSNLTTVFMAILAVFWLRERLTIAEWAAMGLAFAGAALVSQGSGHFDLNSDGLRGDLLMVSAAFFGGIYSVRSKSLVSTHAPEVVTALVATLGALFLMPLAIWEGGSLQLPAHVWAALLVLGIGSGALANLWWLQILAVMDASRAGMLLFLIPVVSTAMAVVWLGEPLTAITFGGALLVLVGVAAMEHNRRRSAR